jgi:membrane-bound serine protease (ClpP class)
MNLTTAYILIAAGFLLLFLELFVPSAGVLSVLSVLSLIAGIVFAFQYGGVVVGMVTLIGVVVLAPIFAALLLAWWPKTYLGKRLVLTPPKPVESPEDQEARRRLEGMQGRIGRTLSALRPAGVVDFDGERVDTITEGTMVDPDQWVRCIAVREGKVIVRPLDKNFLDDLEKADFS